MVVKQRNLPIAIMEKIFSRSKDASVGMKKSKTFKMDKEIIKAIFNRTNLILVVLMLLCFFVLTSCMEDNGLDGEFCYCSEEVEQRSEICEIVCEKAL